MNYAERQGGETVSEIIKDLITKKELGMRLSYSKSTIEAWMKKGCPHEKQFGYAVRFDITKVRDWLKENSN